jgi:hypothetical protein
MRRLLLAAAATLAASTAFAAPCPQGLRPAATAELFFNVGEDEGGPALADWRDFVATEVTPRFRDGLSASEVFGAPPDHGDFAREPARALVLVLSGERTERERIELVRAAYRDRFHHDSTLIMNQRGCVAF